MAVVASACAGDNQQAAAAATPAAPYVYVAKVKNVLVGLPPSDDELAAVKADPAALGGLVDEWMAQPQYRQKMQRFFQLAFQQTQINANDFADQVYGQLGRNAATTGRLLQNIEESFARTMVALTEEGHPLTEAMTTRRLMMTTALKELYAFLDTWQIDNDANISDGFRTANRTVAITVEAAQGPIPIAETLNPNSPNYMHWYDPDVATPGTQSPDCLADPSVLAPNALSLHYLLLGTLNGRHTSDNRYCPLTDGTAAAPQFAPSDFTDWVMVTIRPPAATETPTLFYDLPALRAATELLLTVPRIGFFSTPAFFANWQTNVSNQMRVTINQALIVATGAAVDGADATATPDTPGLDAAHAASGDCHGCHRILDPTRSIFAATWSWYYHHQRDPVWQGQPGLFAFRGVVAPVATIDDFANVLANHPLVAPGWLQKLCAYVNSAPCDEGDPEFARLVSTARVAKLAWKPMVKALVTSPLTTGVAPTRREPVVAVARRDHLCAALNARLGLADVCGLDVLSGAATASDVPQIAAGLPSDGYGRGATAPVLPNDPSVFFQAGIENICKRVAALVIDPAADNQADQRWSSAQPDQAIAAFVATVMGLAAGDPRAPGAIELLRAHFQTAVARPGVTATDALRSAFVVACQSPTAISVGL